LSKGGRWKLGGFHFGGHIKYVIELVVMDSSCTPHPSYGQQM